MTARTALDGDREVAVESFLRGARAQVRARASRTDRFVDAYIVLFVGAVLVAWVVAGISGVGASLGDLGEAGASGGALYRRAASWVGEGAPVVGAGVLATVVWAGAVGLLRGLGPIGVAPDRALWVWPLPQVGQREPTRAARRMLWAALAAAVLLGGICLLLLWGAGRSGALDVQWWAAGAHLVCWACLGIGAVAASVWTQARTAAVAPRRSRPWVGWTVAVGAAATLAASAHGPASGAITAATLALPTSWPVTVLVGSPTRAAVLTAALVVLAAVAAAGVLRQARTLDGQRLRAAGARTRHLSNAVSLMSTQDLRAALTHPGAPAVRALSSGIPGWVHGPRTVVLFASLTALATSRWLSGLVVDVGLTVVVLASFADTVVLAGWAALLVVGYRGLGRGTAYLSDLRAGAGAERSLPLGGTAAAAVHLLVPCALNATALAAVAVLAGLATGLAPAALLAVGAVAGTGIGATAVHRVLAPEPDHTQPPIDTPLGPVPVAQLLGYSRGVLLVPALLAAPAVLLLHPAGWPTALAVAALLTGISVVLAVMTDQKR